MKHLYYTHLIIPTFMQDVSKALFAPYHNIPIINYCICTSAMILVYCMASNKTHIYSFLCNSHLRQKHFNEAISTFLPDCHGFVTSTVA